MYLFLFISLINLCISLINYVSSVRSGIFFCLSSAVSLLPKTESDTQVVLYNVCLMSVECLEYSPNSSTWISNLSYFHPLQGHSPPSHHQSSLLHTLSCPRPWFKLFPVSKWPLSPTHFCLTELLFPSSSVQILPPPRSIFRSPGWNESLLLPGRVRALLLSWLVSCLPCVRFV